MTAPTPERPAAPLPVLITQQADQLLPCNPMEMILASYRRFRPRLRRPRFPGAIALTYGLADLISTWSSFIHK